jgi:hypothetical protein
LLEAVKIVRATPAAFCVARLKAAVAAAWQAIDVYPDGNIDTIKNMVFSEIVKF